MDNTNKTVIDQMDEKVIFRSPPERIVSIVPSQTELLAYLGLEDSLVGITKFCIHPQEVFKNTTRIGGTKNVKLEKVRSLQPDLIIGNKEENSQSNIQQLKSEFPVWMSDISTFAEALDMISQLGIICGKQAESADLIEKINANYNDWQTKKRNQPLRVAYLIWKDPYMVAGGGTFINEMLRIAGYDNCFDDIKRYPQIEIEDLVKKQPEVIFLSSEPYPFAEKHVSLFEEICPDAIPIIVDGELFSWYGSRLLHSFPYFEKLSVQINNLL